jgi:putative phage-type endonuclease
VSLATITAANRAEWLEARRAGLGGSDAAAVLEISPYASRLDVYAEKVGQAPPRVETEALRIGLLMERPILSLYARRMVESCDTAKFAEQVFVRSAAHPWMFATLDAQRPDGVIVEVKNVGWRLADRWGEDGSDEVPDYYLCQCFHQLAVTGAGRVEVAALIGGADFRVYPIERDEAIIARIVEREAEFWERHVLAKVPPPATRAGDARALHALFPEPEGEVELGPELAELADLFAGHGALIRLQEAQRDEAKARLLAALGPAKVGRLPDGRRVVRSIVANPGGTRVVAPYSYSTLKVKDR